MSVYGGYGAGGPGMSGPMQGSQGPQGPTGPNEHETVGAYALGILDDAEATAFEAHLATCEWCAQQLDELAGMEPMLAALADLPGAGTPAIGESLSARPGPRLAERLVDEVAERRAQKRRRGFYMVAAAAALIVGGPFVAVATSGGDDGGGNRPVAAHATAPPRRLRRDRRQGHGHRPRHPGQRDRGTGEEGLGHARVLELKNVKGPLKCSLIAVGKNGERETVTSWSVPDWGYGLPDATPTRPSSRCTSRAAPPLSRTRSTTSRS
ncbi:Putative zinc-finger domain-containing protein OS=Streptomyces glaucescens OX=1907 GN=SGLAU_13380 PE=4 SV=1 [Streptomyces glaucescens]